MPTTDLGKLVGAAIAIFGAMFILLPVLKLVNAFSDALEVTRAQLAQEGEQMTMQGIDVKSKR